MDISRLPVAPPGGPSPALTRKAPRPAFVEAVEPVAAPQARRSAREPLQRTVQGELLQRERNPAQSTRGFINERNLNQAQSVGHPAPSPEQSRPAIARYLNNTRPEAVADLTQGRSVNFFV
ncbi:MAG TPA: hypothetical protein ENJ80_14725 [Gammaproteobacteria bacterium]|nr:hypothetical protein [Gammaproteobacteria bacterium]